MEEQKPVGLDITNEVIQRLASHILSIEDTGDEAELENKAFLLPIVEESVAQYRVTHQRGFVLCHRIASPYGFYYVEQANTEQALKRIPVATMTALTHSLEAYEPECEAVLIALTMDDVHHIDIGAAGEARLTELRERPPLDMPPGVTTKRSGEEPDWTQSLDDYLQAETDAEARAILEAQPELLTNPEVEKAWQSFWAERSTPPQRITNRHKLWKRKRKQHARKEDQAPRGTRRAQEDTGEIQWQPISALPQLAALVDGMWQDDQEQHTLYLEVRDRPHVLDDATVKRAVRLYHDRLDILTTRFEPQFARWQAEPLTDAQRQEVKRLVERLADLKALDEKILELLDEITKGTIDAVMRKSDFELGVEALYGRVALTDKQNQLAQKIDGWVKGIEQRGDGDAAILQGMYDYMAPFKQIMDSSTSAQMDKLCAQYPGFYRFAMLLEDLARGIQNGEIDVPR